MEQDALVAALKQRFARGAVVVDEADLDSAEEAMGFTFPPLLRTILLHVGSGWGVSNAHRLLHPLDCARRHRSKPRPDWPERLVSFADWGCGIQSCVTFEAADDWTWWFDPNVDGPEPDAYAPLWRSDYRLADWFGATLAGENLLLIDHWPPR